jgi:uncharacterized protein
LKLPYPISNREPWVDALRALALLGVFIVNAMGYPSAPNYPMPLGAPNPLDSTIAVWINGFLAAFVQGKAYPLLCFLFGYSLCSIAFQTNTNQLVVKARLKLRCKKLLLVGILHGVFVYFGDVLTIYAICGLIALRWVSIRPAKLLRIFKRLSIANLCMALLLAIVGVIIWFDSGEIERSYAKDSLENFITIDSFKVFFIFNFNNYIENSFYGLFMLPLLLWLMVAGILVYRFKLFSCRRYAHKFWKNYLHKWHFMAALFLNFTVGIFIAFFQSIPNLNKVISLEAIATPINIWLIAATLAMGMRYWHKVQYLPNWVYWLAPAGKHTLAMYLALSLGLMLSGNAFLNIQGSTPVRLFSVICAWIVAVLLAKQATNRGFRDPVASWLSVKN